MIVTMKGLPVADRLAKLEKTQFFSPEQISRLQQEKLRIVLQHAAQHVSFYSKKISVTDSCKLDIFPFVTKKDIIINSTEFLSVKSHGRLYKKTTGGSTGQALTVLKDSNAFTSALAATWRGYGWAGVGVGDKQARFWGVPITTAGRIKMLLTDFVAHRKRFSAFAFTDSDLEAYAATLRKFGPDYFYGYVSMLNQYAEFLTKNNSTAPTVNLKAIITTSEILADSIRKKLESVFHARVYNEYGCGELGTIAHECEHGRLHINDENMIVEIYDGDRKCSFGEVGEIVVTELNNFAMPLIKYRLGDFAALSDQICPCGRGLSILDNLYGRAYDMIRNKDGILFHGEFFMYIFEEAKRKGLGISSFQVIQKQIDQLKIKIIPERGYGAKTEAFISNYFQKNFSETVDIVFVRVSEIKRANSGKMRLIIAADDPITRVV